MTTSHAFHAASAPSTTAPARVPAAARMQRLQATVMIAVILAFAAVFTGVFGAIGIFVMAISLPVPMLFLWAASDVVRSDEASL